MKKCKLNVHKNQFLIFAYSRFLRLFSISSDRASYIIIHHLMNLLEKNVWRDCNTFPISPYICILHNMLQMESITAISQSYCMSICPSRKKNWWLEWRNGIFTSTNWLSDGEDMDSARYLRLWNQAQCCFKMATTCLKKHSRTLNRMMENDGILKRHLKLEKLQWAW